MGLLNWWLGQFHGAVTVQDPHFTAFVWFMTVLGSTLVFLVSWMEWSTYGADTRWPTARFFGRYPRLAVLIWLLLVLFGPWILELALVMFVIWGLCWFLQPALQAGWSVLKWAWIFTPSRIKTKAKPTLEELEKLAEQVRKEIEELGKNL